jgi:chorismate lyase
MDWFPADDAMRARVPASLWPWLTETGSLTRRLQDRCPRAFGLRVLDEREVDADDADARALDLAPPLRALYREVHLCCGGVPCIHALSVIPLATLAGAGRMLDGLGARPLGDALFAHPQMTRGPIELAERDDAWGRRSVFRLAGEPLLVSEWFLPGLLECAR